jgi:hypothetical protein
MPPGKRAPAHPDPSLGCERVTCFYMARCRAARRSRCRSESQRPRSIRLPSRIRRADRKRQIRSSRGSAPRAVPITGPPLRMPRMTTSDHLVAALDDHGSAAKPASTCLSRKKRLTSGGQRDVIVAPNRSVDRVLTRSILALYHEIFDDERGEPSTDSRVSSASILPYVSPWHVGTTEAFREGLASGNHA